MYLRTSVPKNSNGGSPGASAPKEPNVTIVATEDILTWPTKDSKGVLYTGSFVMKPNAKMISVYMTASKIKASYESDGDEDVAAFKHKFEGEHPGDSLEIAEFIQNWMGVNCIIIYGSCSDTYRKVQGTKCAPLQLKATGTDDNDSRKNMLNFEAFVKTRHLPGRYTGTLSLGTPSVVTAYPMPIGTSLGTVYQLPSKATVENIQIINSDFVDGDVITLIGGGGAGASELINGAGAAALTAQIVTKGGATWVGLLNSTITLRVMISNKTFLFEENRTL